MGSHQSEYWNRQFSWILFANLPSSYPNIRCLGPKCAPLLPQKQGQDTLPPSKKDVNCLLQTMHIIKNEFESEVWGLGLLKDLTFLISWRSIHVVLKLLYTCFQYFSLCLRSLSVLSPWNLELWCIPSGLGTAISRQSYKNLGTASTGHGHTNLGIVSTGHGHTNLGIVSIEHGHTNLCIVSFGHRHTNLYIVSIGHGHTNLGIDSIGHGHTNLGIVSIGHGHTNLSIASTGHGHTNLGTPVLGMATQTWALPVLCMATQTWALLVAGIVTQT